MIERYIAHHFHFLAADLAKKPVSSNENLLVPPKLFAPALFPFHRNL